VRSLGDGSEYLGVAPHSFGTTVTNAVATASRSSSPVPPASAQPQRSRRDLRVAAPKDDNFGSVMEALFDKITCNQNMQQEQQQHQQIPRVTQLIDEIMKAHEFRDSAIQKNDARLLRMAEMLIDRLENEIQQSASAFSIN
jgi:hypothetical protein